MKTLSYIAAALAVAVLGIASTSIASQYVYTDDFSTDKAMSDSYWHSEFLEEIPDPWPTEGFLRYEPYGEDRMLSFYLGNNPFAIPEIWYEFPIDERMEGVLPGTATVEFDLVNIWGGGYIRCGLSADAGASWEWHEAVFLLGHYTFDFEAPSPSETVLVRLWAPRVSIDEFSVVLHDWTPVEELSWSRIKQLYRRPAN